jgi:hypothetical protein
MANAQTWIQFEGGGRQQLSLSANEKRGGIKDVLQVRRYVLARSRINSRNN